VERLEKRIGRRLGSGEAETKYSRFTGSWQFDVQGFGTMIIKVFTADGLLWASVEGGVLGDRAEFIPVEGRPLEFKLDSDEQGLIDWQFIEDDKGAVIKAQFYLQSENIKAQGFKKL
jgi:hypothetical protein